MRVEHSQGCLTPLFQAEDNQRFFSTSLGLAGRIAASAATARPNEGGNTAVDTPIADVHAVGGSDAPPARSGSEDGRSGAAAHRLEKRTHLDEARYRIILKNYGNGLAEIGWSFIPANLPTKAGRGLSEHRDANESRAARRARSRLRQLILSSRADHLLTLTYRENMTDFTRAGNDLSRFVRLVKSNLPGWVYIAVAENQKRGAWHWHLAVVGRQDVVLLRSLWRQVVGDGNIDVNPPKGKEQHRLLGLVKYLGKYLAKGFEEQRRELNGRRFRSSLGIDVPTQSLMLPDEYRDNAAAYALNQLRAVAGGIGFTWQPTDIPAGWACSWK